MKTLTAYVMIATTTLLCAGQSQASWGDSYLNPTLTTINGVKITKNSLEHALVRKFKKSAKIFRLAKNWDTWNPKYVLQDFTDVRSFIRNIHFGLIVEKNGKTISHDSMFCTLHVLQQNDHYQVSLDECENVTPNSKQISNFDITEAVLATSERVKEDR